MAHVPHLLVPPPWPGAEVRLPPPTVHHLATVLRRSDGEVSYTDGEGTRGSGHVFGDRLVRGDELSEPRPIPHLTILAAPPKEVARARFGVEKAAELGVARLGWLDTEYREGRVPKPAKTAAWAAAALEQSGRSWLLQVDKELTPCTKVPGDALLADEVGEPISALDLGETITVLIGPEGGWAPADLVALDGGGPGGQRTRVALADGVLRVETAVLAAAALVMAGG